MEHYINIEDLKALIMPYNALGSSIVADALKRNIKVIAIKENSSVLKITKDVLNESDIIEINTYEECYKYLKERINEK